VQAIEPLGAETLLVLEVEGIADDVVARIARDAAAGVGDRIEIRLDRRAARLVDVASGRSLMRTSPGANGSPA